MRRFMVCVSRPAGTVQWFGVTCRNLVTCDHGYKFVDGPGRVDIVLLVAGARLVYLYELPEDAPWPALKYLKHLPEEMDQ